MAQILDVAKYITESMGEISAMKLQKLMYYSQAWHMTWEDDQLFEEDFEAWANGPVLPSLYQLHKGMFKVSSKSTLFSNADAKKITEEEKSSIDEVLKYYGKKTAQWLSSLTHQEDPWLKARGECAPGERCSNIISKASIHEYYSAL